MNESTTVTPGRVNAHTHIYSGLVPFGMPEPDPRPKNFLEILQRVWWRLDRALDEEILRASAQLYVAEALLEGTTALIDHHESPEFIEGSLDVIADVCEELGMRAVLCYGATERNHGHAEARRGLEECARFLQANERRLVRGVVGLHAGFTVSDETLREGAGIARDLRTVFHMHVAEDKLDVRDAQKRGYEGCIDRLIRLGALPPRSVFAHGVHLTPDEVKDCVDLSCWIVQNPRSNHSNQVGYPHAIGASERVALGTDGFPADMVDEAEMLILQSTAHGEELEQVADRLPAGHDLLNDCFDDAVPEVEVTLGKVVVDGRTIVQHGRLLTGDIEEIRAHAREAAQKLWKRMEGL
jgi:cytosine/adenosine deaminase-related metal-dependent hydrolase